jgi:hypothetical protein
MSDAKFDADVNYSRQMEKRCYSPVGFVQGFIY